MTYSLSEWSELPKKGLGFPIIFHAVKGEWQRSIPHDSVPKNITGEDKREGSSPSWFNPTEVSTVGQWVKKLREDGSKLGLRSK